MKKYLFAGLLTLLPAALTLILIYFLFDLFTAPFVPLVAHLLSWLQHLLPFSLPMGTNTFFSRLLALILLFVFVFLLGFVARYFFVSSFIRWANRIFFRIPFIKTVYKVSSDIISALFSQDGKKIFKQPVIIPFPDRPNYCLGFLAGDVPEECSRNAKEPLISVFAPTAPHPISGFLFLLPEKDVQKIDMTNEEALKFLVSCGIIIPERQSNDRS